MCVRMLHYLCVGLFTIIMQSHKAVNGHVEVKKVTLSSMAEFSFPLKISVHRIINSLYRLISIHNKYISVKKENLQGFKVTFFPK